MLKPMFWTRAVQKAAPGLNVAPSLNVCAPQMPMNKIILHIYMN